MNAVKKNNTNTSWGEVAGWYNKLLEEDSDSYQAKVIKPNLLRLLDVKKTDNVLDLGCGQGYFLREVAKIAAQVVGVDVAGELVKFAQSKAKQNEKYFVMSAENLSGLKDVQFDIVFSVLAVQNIKSFQLAFLEVAKKLKPQGRFLLVLNHPNFRIPKQTVWVFDEKNNIQYRRVDAYLSETQNRIDMTPGEKNEKKKKYTWSFHRPLQVYFKAFHKAGFVVSKLEEWVSHKESDKGKRKMAEDKARKEIPMFMCIELKKI